MSVRDYLVCDGCGAYDQTWNRIDEIEVVLDD